MGITPLKSRKMIERIFEASALLGPEKLKCRPVSYETLIRRSFGIPHNYPRGISPGKPRHFVIFEPKVRYIKFFSTANQQKMHNSHFWSTLAYWYYLMALQTTQFDLILTW